MSLPDRILLSALFATALASALALAPAPAVAATVAASSLSEIVSQQREIAARLDAGDSGLDARTVDALRRQQLRVFAIVEGRASLEELTPDEKMALHNALENISAELQTNAQAQEQSRVCRREHRLGSQLKVRRCYTRAELRQARNDTQATLVRPRACEAGCSVGGL